MSVNPVKNFATRGNIREAYQACGLRPKGAPSLAKLLKKRDGLMVKQNNIPIFEIFCRKMGLAPTPETFAKIKQQTNGKPYAHMLDVIIG